MTESFHRSCYLFIAPVRDAVSEHVDYLSPSNERGLDGDRITPPLWEVVQAMRGGPGLSIDVSDTNDP